MNYEDDFLNSYNNLRSRIKYAEEKAIFSNISKIAI